MSEILVSVYCLAYNHEKYIRSALEGFVCQKTKFAFEVFVHDDASQDRTACIIMEYSKKYPEIIKPIFQKENLYSQGKSALYEYILPRMQGKYIAVCEGDDYWCDPYKLQVQIDFLEAHNECVACTHNSYVYNERTGKETLFCNKRRGKYISLKEIMRWNDVFQSSSLVYRREMQDLHPRYLKSIAGVGDFTFALWLKLNGEIYYIDKPMSKYRSFTAGSWTERNPNQDENAKVKIMILEAFNKESNFKFNKKVRVEIDRLKMEIMYRNKCIDELIDIGYHRILKVGYIWMAVSIFLQKYNYKLYKWISKTFYANKKL